MAAMAATLSLPSLSISNATQNLVSTSYSNSRQRSGPFAHAIRAANAEGPLRRPSVPTPSIATSPAPPSPPTSSPAPSPSPSHASAPPPPTQVTPAKSTAVSIEYQRQRAKELREYFLDKKYEEKIRGERIFGWTRKNEITNGRYGSCISHCL